HGGGAIDAVRSRRLPPRLDEHRSRAPPRRGDSPRAAPASLEDRIVSQKRTLRVFCTRHADGRWTGLLMRWRERFFDIPPPSAYGDTWEEVLAQLESVMTERLARM